MSDSLKSISDVIVESRIVSTRMDIASTATTQVKAILDMVLSLPEVHSGHYLHLFSTLYFMEKERDGVALLNASFICNHCSVPFQVTKEQVVL
uniref:Uncharacterized protein n=1 Tax=Quercus lobata TaxID=97700 RepID=A0A7N2LUZ3_QUELO